MWNKNKTFTYSQNIIIGDIPNNIKHVIFDSTFTLKVRIHIPQNIKHITFNGNCIPCDIPSTITKLTLGPSFVNENFIIPSTVTHLVIDSNSIPCIIPLTITHLIFGDDFNQAIKGIIPKSVKHLTINYRYNQNIEKYHIVSHI